MFLRLSFLLFGLIIFPLFLIFANFNPVYAQKVEAPLDAPFPIPAAGSNATEDLGPGPANVEDLQRILERLPNVGVALAFIALTGVLVWAGIKFLTSGGDPKQVQAAYDMVTWAILGIFFLAIAWLILLLVENFTGVPVTKFCIGFDCK